MLKVILNKKYSCGIILFFFACQPIYAQHSITGKIDQIIKSSVANDAFWSVSVRDTTGNVLIGINNHRLMSPSSNLMLLTSSAILHALGPDYTFKTRIYGDGVQKDSVWNGDIYIVGSGDPSIGGDIYNGDKLHVFDDFYAKLDTLGIAAVNGYLIGNNSYFDNKEYPYGWNWNDLTYSFAPEIDALSFNNNCVDLTVNARGRVGDTPSIKWFPFNTDYVHFINEQSIIPSNIPENSSYRRILGTNTILLKSSLSQNSVKEESLTITNPPLYFIDSFKKYLQMNGFVWDGNMVIDHREHNWQDTTMFRQLAVHESVPVKDLLEQINKDDNNFYVEMMLKAAAAKEYNVQGSTELGIQMVEEYAADMGIDTTKVLMSDGSGLSDQDLINTDAISKLLFSMRKQPLFPTYKNSLSTASLDGTLENRFWNTPLKAKINGNFGFRSGIAAFSGYLTTSNNHLLMFSIIANHVKNHKTAVIKIEDKILELLYQVF